MTCRFYFYCFHLFFDKSILKICWHDVQIKNGKYIFAVFLNRMLHFLSLKKKGEKNPWISVGKSLLLTFFFFFLVPVDLLTVHLEITINIEVEYTDLMPFIKNSLQL